MFQQAETGGIRVCLPPTEACAGRYFDPVQNDSTTMSGIGTDLDETEVSQGRLWSLPGIELDNYGEYGLEEDGEEEPARRVGRVMTD